MGPERLPPFLLNRGQKLMYAQRFLLPVVHSKDPLLEDAIPFFTTNLREERIIETQAHQSLRSDFSLFKTNDLPADRYTSNTDDTIFLSYGQETPDKQWEVLIQTSSSPEPAYHYLLVTDMDIYTLTTTDNRKYYVEVRSTDRNVSYFLYPPLVQKLPHHPQERDKLPAYIYTESPTQPAFFTFRSAVIHQHPESTFQVIDEQSYEAKEKNGSMFPSQTIRRYLRTIGEPQEDAYQIYITQNQGYRIVFKTFLENMELVTTAQIPGTWLETKHQELFELTDNILLQEAKKLPPGSTIIRFGVDTNTHITTPGALFMFSGQVDQYVGKMSSGDIPDIVVLPYLPPQAPRNSLNYASLNYQGAKYVWPIAPQGFILGEPIIFSQQTPVTFEYLRSN